MLSKEAKQALEEGIRSAINEESVKSEEDFTRFLTDEDLRLEQSDLAKRAGCSTFEEAVERMRNGEFRGTILESRIRLNLFLMAGREDTYI